MSGGRWAVDGPGAHLAHSLSSDATRMLCGSREPLWSHRVGVRYGREGCPGKRDPGGRGTGNSQTEGDTVTVTVDTPWTAHCCHSGEKMHLGRKGEPAPPFGAHLQTQ